MSNLLNLRICGGDVEVTGIDHSARQVAMIIHLNVPVAEIQSLQAREELAEKARAARHYLIVEGFLPKRTNDWKFHMAGISTTKA